MSCQAGVESLQGKEGPGLRGGVLCVLCELGGKALYGMEACDSAMAGGKVVQG